LQQGWVSVAKNLFLPGMRFNQFKPNKTDLNQKTQNTSTKVSSPSRQQDFSCVL